jgi:hypothetical protein
MTARPLHTLIRCLCRRADLPGDAALTDAQLLECLSGQRDQAEEFKSWLLD